MRVKKLSADVRSRLESGLIITDATQCAMELVENALDAKCTSVAVRINLKEYRIEVVDNGIGISPSDLNLVGERFMTSKCWSMDDVDNNMGTFGYRGQAIASIIDVSSKLLIKTKSELSSKTLVKVFAKGKSPSISVSSQEKCGTGTTITVYNFMCTMPIRQKRIKEIFDMQEIKGQLEYLALIHNEVTFTLRDENKREIVLQSQTRRNAGFSFADLFGMAVGKFLVPFQCNEHKIEIEGFIALERHSENNLQFFYVNRRIVSKSLTHKFVNSLIDKYLNERQTLIDEIPDVKEINMNIGKGSHNVYLVKIRCPYSEYEMFRNSRKTTVEFKNWDRILHCLKSAIKSALKVETGNIDSDNIVQNRKTENVKNLPRKGDMELGQLKCGIRGVFVKRNQCELVLSNEKTVSNHINIFEKEIINGVHQRSSMDEIKNNFPTGNELSRWLPHDRSEINDTINELVTPLNYETKKLNEEKCITDKERIGKENVDNNFLIEFAVWLKSKMANDHFIQKKYREFITENIIVCKNVKKLKFGKQEGKLCKKFPKRIENEGNRGKKRKFCTEAKELEIGKLSSSRRKSTGDNNNNEVKHLKIVKDKKFGKWKKERSDGSECLKSLKNVKIRSGNELIQLSSSFTGSNNFISGDIKPFKGCINSNNYFAHGESPKSWISHSNRTAFEKNCNYSSVVNFRLDENDEREPRTTKFFAKKKEMGTEGEKDGEKRTCVNILEKKGLKEHREREVQTSITALNCDELTEKNLKIWNGKGLDIYTTRNAKECVFTNIPENKKSNSESGSVTGEVNFTSETIFNYLNSAVDPPQLSDSRSLPNDSAREDPKGNVSHNLPDTLSLVENILVGDGKCATSFTCTDRYTFIPKGLSPTVLNGSFTKVVSRREEIMERKLEAPEGTWEENSCELFSKSLLPEEVVEGFKKNIAKNMIHYESELMKSYLTKIESKINFSLNSFTVDKHVLSNVKVIGQWDNKFIIGKTGHMLPEEKQLLFVFDQHAVDERIQFEQLLKDFRNTDGKFISMNCIPPIRCKMEESMLRLIPSLETVFQNFGIKVSIVDSEHALFQQIPVCAVQNNVDNVEVFLKNIVNEIIEEYNETRGSGSSIPRIMFTIISTRACKSAIKFNDSLSLDEMTKLIDDLVLCQIPFQCAHGRPSVVPVLNLAAFRNQMKKIEEKLNFKKFRKSKSEL